MYVAKENQKKIITICIVIFLATVSIITGKTLANTVILTFYPTWILPYFYFALAISTMITTVISSKYLKKSEKKFSIIFKIIVLCSLLVFIPTLNSGWLIAPFCISILLLTYTSVISLIAWNYASDIFDIQEFKKFSKAMQVSSTSGAIAAGLLVGTLSEKYSSSKLLGLIFLVELMSLFFIKPLAKYAALRVSATQNNLVLSSSIKQSSIFKYLALITFTSLIVATLIDYNLKLELVADIDKEKIAHILSIIFVISTTCILIVQFFLLDYFFRVLGSKKIIIIYPIAILIAALVTVFHFNFISMAVLFIINDVFAYTTSSLSRNLYLNVLPQAMRLLDRLKLNGTITPLAMMSSSLIVFCITYLRHKSMLALVLVILICIYSLFLARILINQYRIQLSQSVYLRRFNRDLINMSPVDNKDMDDSIKQALNYPDPEAVLFGLQLLSNYNSLNLPDSLIDLLTGDNPAIVREVARILASRRNQQQFKKAGQIAFLKSQDEETKWYLALYLIESDDEYFLFDTMNKAINNTGVSLAIWCLINVKQGDLEQQIRALHSLLQMLHSQDIEQKKWFLYVLNEITMLQKEKYLIQFINQDSSTLQILALQQVGPNPSDNLLAFMVDHLGEPNISYVLNACFIEIGDRVIDPIESKFKKATAYTIKMSCVRALSSLTGSKAEICLMNLLSTSQDVVINTVIAKYIAYRGVKIKISQELINFLIEKMKIEVEFYSQLSAQLSRYKNPLIQEEINSRRLFIKKRVLYYTAAVIGSLDILNSIPLLTSFRPDKNQQAIALELIDSTIENRKIVLFLMALFLEDKRKDFTTNLPMDDPWLSKYIQDIESKNMDLIYMLTRLRKIDLFKNLAAETLQVLAECCSSKDMASGEIIFNEGDAGDGLYIIDSGEVSVTKNGVLISKLSEGAYFGELALLADIPRFATITALSEGGLFFINKQDFDKITDEIPEIMKSINKQVINYLIANAEQEGI
ncbi:cyclic nucleotide-binding domain-containing protein [Legionella maioricensis]|uniref:Cyclic nucleotide-binding domain-containing protein n=1 Tax=Legionella maioricensis TaxID=2896528 RepID=A0A9X2D1R3_9GAMM|nr:cyclic nucleotide-binding domain-containing protein [Legionella maioricensis]MCL9684749.1 cyclic nucleotide-binding domain-containing protein [Legionella maioricensis]MCL9687849.1 cyclic nucleotide-binding domain-containing protein [Legionella maioricensis]